MATRPCLPLSNSLKLILLFCNGSFRRHPHPQPSGWCPDPTPDPHRGPSTPHSCTDRRGKVGAAPPHGERGRRECDCRVATRSGPGEIAATKAASYTVTSGHGETAPENHPLIILHMAKDLPRHPGTDETPRSISSDAVRNKQR